MIVAIGAPVLLLTQPFVGGPGSALLLGVIVAGLLPVLRRDSVNLDGHLRAGAEIVLALLRQSKAATPSPDASDHDRLHGFPNSGSPIGGREAVSEARHLLERA